MSWKKKHYRTNWQRELYNIYSVVIKRKNEREYAINHKKNYDTKRKKLFVFLSMTNEPTGKDIVYWILIDTVNLQQKFQPLY